MLNNILKGIQAYFGVFGLISKLKLWKYFFVPMLISLITAIIIGVSAYGFSDTIANYVTSLLPDWANYSWVTTVFAIISNAGIITLGLILYKYIVLALSAPFMSPVSEKIETHLTGIENNTFRNTSFQQQLWRGIRLNIRNFLMELVLTVPILILNFLPLIGNISSTVLLFLLQSYYAGFGNMDYTLERHYNYAESSRFVRNHRGMAIGNGIVFLLFLFIPIVGVVLVLPLSVTAASTETVKRIQYQKSL